VGALLVRRWMMSKNGQFKCLVAQVCSTSTRIVWRLSYNREDLNLCDASKHFVFEYLKVAEGHLLYPRGGWMRSSFCLLMLVLFHFAIILSLFISNMSKANIQ
jgi:hypothetical protein